MSTQSVPVDPTRIPMELKERKQWVSWRGAPRGDGKTTKIPTNPRTGRNCKTNDPAGWGTFEEALGALERGKADGIGFVFTAADPYVGVDLDNAVRDGGLLGWAEPDVALLDSYTEVSPSGTGVHVIARADRLPPGWKTFSLASGKAEVYSEGRFFTVSGQVLGSRGKLAERSSELAALRADLEVRMVRGEDEGAAWVPGVGNAIGGSPMAPPEPVVLLPLDDEVLSTCRRFPKFAALYDHGDTAAYAGDDSAADSALVFLLRRGGAADPAQVDRLFRTSALMRRKWNRRDYREGTIAKAFALVVPGVDDRGEEEQLRARVANLEREVARFRQREGRNAELLSALGALGRCGKLGKGAAVAHYLATRCAYFESVDAAKPFPISVTEVARSTGVHRNTASRWCQIFAGGGLLERDVRGFARFVDPESGEILEVPARQVIAPVGTALEFLQAVLRWPPQSNWGGNRKRARSAVPAERGAEALQLGAPHLTLLPTVTSPSPDYS